MKAKFYGDKDTKKPDDISNPVEPSGKTSNASFLKWFVPVIDALRKLGGSATPEEVRNQIAADLNLRRPPFSRQVKLTDFSVSLRIA